MLSSDLSYATLYLDSAVHALYQTQFHNLRNICSSILIKIEDPIKLYFELAHYEKENLTKNIPSFSFAIFTQPCLIFCADRYFYDKYMYSFPSKDEVVDLYAARSDLYFNAIKNGYVYTSHFTLSGLDEFWRTGRIQEVPEDFYSPLEPCDRLALIERMVNLADTSSYHTILIRTERIEIPNNFIIFSLVENMLVFFYIHPQKGLMQFVFNELSIKKSFISFISYLKNSDMVVSAEETLTILKSKLEQYREELAALKH